MTLYELQTEVEKLRKDLESTEHALSSTISKYEKLQEETIRLIAVLKRHNINFE